MSPCQTFSFRRSFSFRSDSSEEDDNRKENGEEIVDADNKGMFKRDMSMKPGKV